MPVVLPTLLLNLSTNKLENDTPVMRDATFG